jgi:hypothetical protein
MPRIVEPIPLKGWQHANARPTSGRQEIIYLPSVRTAALPGKYMVVDFAQSLSGHPQLALAKR